MVTKGGTSQASDLGNAVLLKIQSKILGLSDDKSIRQENRAETISIHGCSCCHRDHVYVDNLWKTGRIVTKHFVCDLSDKETSKVHT